MSILSNGTIIINQNIMDSVDACWTILCIIFIFTMQTGFALLEVGIISNKSAVNVMMKNVLDISLGGLTYWIFGYSMSFGSSSLSNGFIGVGDYFVDPLPPSSVNGTMGSLFKSFLFQMSFATTSTTIVSGAVAERCTFKAYCIFVLINTIVYTIPAGWVWGSHGFLFKLGVVDIAGSGPIHLVGGASAFAAAASLGPRLGRYTNGKGPLPLSDPVRACVGLFILWWGWLAFNSGSTFGLSGALWQYASRAAVMTMMGAIGGGFSSLIYSNIKNKGVVDPADIINGTLAALVSVTAGCFLYRSWEAWIIGGIGALLTLSGARLIDAIKVDDPVGASSVHGICGIWGVLAVGLFADNPIPIGTTNDRAGLFKGGGWYLLGVQALSALCLLVWGLASTFSIFFLINKICPIRLKPDEELLGTDFVEHGINRLQIHHSEPKSGNIGDFTFDELKLAEEKLREWRTFLNQLSPLQTPQVQRKEQDLENNSNKISSVSELFTKKFKSNTEANGTTKGGNYRKDDTELPVYVNRGFT